MRLPLQCIVIGIVASMWTGSGVTGGRARRQGFFFFPGDESQFDSREFFDNSFFQNRFDEQYPSQAPQFAGNDQFFQSQGRVPFPTPIQPGPPAIIDSPQMSTTTVTPDTVVTTATPAFFACMQNCPTTSEYNPICGTNRQLYHNQQKFDCAIRCGARAQIWRRGSCEGLFPMSRG